MTLVPILDDDDHILEILNLDKYYTRLPIDAVLMGQVVKVNVFAL